MSEDKSPQLLALSGICLYKAVLFLLPFLWGPDAIVTHRTIPEEEEGPPTYIIRCY